MLDLLKTYWYYFVEVACASITLLSLVITFIQLKKHKVPIKAIIKVVSSIPGLVSSAEYLFPNGNGDRKFKAAESLFNSLVRAYNVEDYSKFIDFKGICDEVLKAPQASIYKNQGGDDSASSKNS